MHQIAVSFTFHSGGNDEKSGLLQFLESASVEKNSHIKTVSMLETGPHLYYYSFIYLTHLQKNFGTGDSDFSTMYLSSGYNKTRIIWIFFIKVGIKWPLLIPITELNGANAVIFYIDQ